MFCQKCGAELLNATKFCVKCGQRLKTEPRISNKAMLIAGIAALVSIGSAVLSYWPGSASVGTTAATATPTATSSANPTPTSQIAIVKATPKPKPTKEPEPEEESEAKPTPRPQRPKPEPMPDYPYRHTPTLIYPDDGALFSYGYSSGRIVFRWRPIAGSNVDGYKMEVEYGNLSHQPPWLLREYETPWSYCTVKFTDVQGTEFAGRWRVSPIFADGRSGIPTEWRAFRFTR